MKKTIAMILTLVLLVSCVSFLIPGTLSQAEEELVWSGNVDTSWFRDTSAKEYKIRTAEELAGLANIVNGGNTFEGKTIYLENDIILNQGDASTWKQTPPKNEWIPIGTDGKQFKGTFNGKGHTVSGMHISYTKESGASDDQQGFFGVVAQTASGVDAPSVKNVSVVNSYINNTCAEKVAMLIGQIYVNKKVNSTEIRVENVYVQGRIDSTYLNKDGKGAARVGGIACMKTFQSSEASTLVFKNAVSDVDVTSTTTTYLGGILACDTTSMTPQDKNTKVLTYDVFENCVNLGDLISDWNGCTVGGIYASTGSYYKVTMTNCVNAGNIKGQKLTAGLNISNNNEGSTVDVKQYINTGEVTPVDTPYSQGAAGAIYGATVPSKVQATFEQCYSIPVKNLDGAMQYTKKVLTGDGALTTLASNEFNTAGWVVVSGVAPMPKTVAVVCGLIEYDNNRLAAVQNTQAKNGLMTVRLVGGINNLEYKKVGFKVTVNEQAVSGVETNIVSTVISYDDNGTTKKMDAYTGFLTPYVYFDELENISATANVEIKATPYFIDLKGNKVEGDEYTVIYEAGVLKKAYSAKGGLIIKEDGATGYNKPESVGD